MKKIKIAVAGSSGRMGRALLEAVLHGADTELGGALEVVDSPSLGKNAGEMIGAMSDVLVSADIDAAIAGCSALIDFTRPEGTLVHLAACRKLGVNLVIGTTGFSESQKKTIAEAAQDIGIVMAPNMSVGVNLLFYISRKVTEILGEDYAVFLTQAQSSFLTKELGTVLNKFFDTRNK